MAKQDVPGFLRRELPLLKASPPPRLPLCSSPELMATDEQQRPSAEVGLHAARRALSVRLARASAQLSCT